MALGSIEEKRNIGFDTEEIENDYEKQGITGKIGRFALESENFPQFVVTLDETSQVNEIQVQSLKGMFNTATAVEEASGDEVATSISIYIHEKDKKVRLGNIKPRQVKAFLRLFDGCKVEGWYDKNTHLTGDMLYVLCD